MSRTVITLALLAILFGGSAQTSFAETTVISTSTATSTATSTPPKPVVPPKKPSSSNSQSKSLLQGLLQQLKSSLSNILNNALQPPAAPVQAAASQAGPSCVVINFGGQVIAPPILCTTPPGAALVTIGPPKPQMVMCLQGPTCMETPYLYGPPLIPSQWAIGCYAPAPVPCVVGGVVVGVGVPVVITGTSMPGGGVPAPAPAPTQSTPKGKKDVCGQYDAEAGKALDGYGPNLIFGKPSAAMQADMADFCPNYGSMSPAQRRVFWTNFTSALEVPESSCQSGPSSYSPEPLLSSPSEGLLQLSYGDHASCHPDACAPLKGNYRQYDRNDPNQPIYNPQINLNCGIAIMDCRSFGGITNTKIGLGSYWSTVRTSHGQSLANIKASAGASPGCN